MFNVSIPRGAIFHADSKRRRDVEFTTELRQLANLIALGESCSRQLRGWADSLQNSDIKGQRHLNQKVRQQADQQKKAAILQKELLRKLPPSHPLRRDAEEGGRI
jgi:hypothetical protein